MKVIDVVIILLLAGLALLAIRYMIRNKKQGKSITGCPGDCSNCAYRDKDCTLPHQSVKQCQGDGYIDTIFGEKL